MFTLWNEVRLMVKCFCRKWSCKSCLSQKRFCLLWKCGNTSADGEVQGEKPHNGARPTLWRNSPEGEQHISTTLDKIQRFSSICSNVTTMWTTPCSTLACSCTGWVKHVEMLACYKSSETTSCLMEVGLAGFSHMYSEPFTAKLMSPSDRQLQRQQ